MEYILHVEEAAYDVLIDGSNDIDITVGESINVINTNVYDGTYEVTPALTETVLPTEGYYMQDNVTVHEIPIIRTTNPTGGLTVVIG